MAATLGETWTRIILLSGWFMGVLAVVGIVAAAVYLFIAVGDIPAKLADWATLCLGFIFGAVFNAVKDKLG